MGVVGVDLEADPPGILDARVGVVGVDFACRPLSSGIEFCCDGASIEVKLPCTDAWLRLVFEP